MPAAALVPPTVAVVMRAPVAPADWKNANQLPAVTAEPYMAAAVEPAAMPAVPKPMSMGMAAAAPTTAPVPAIPMPTFYVSV